MKSPVTKNAEEAYTITLVRGRNYSLLHPTDRKQPSLRFVKGEPVVLSSTKIKDLPKVIEAIRMSKDVVTDTDGEEVEKDMFIVRDGDLLSDDDEDTTPVTRRASVPSRRRLTR